MTRLYEFDALRAVSTLLLLALHSEVFALNNVLGIDLNPFALFVGAFLLGSFFFMAGYFEELSLQKNGSDSWRFIVTKFIRIYPPYWLALILFVFVTGYSLNKRFDQLVYMFNLQFLFSPAFVKQILTLWFISVLVVYYILTLMMRKWIQSEKVKWAVLIIIFCALFFVHLQTRLFDIRFFEYFFIFFLGTLIAKAPSVMQKINQISIFSKLFLLIVSALLLWFAQAGGYELENPFFLLIINFFIVSSILFSLALFRSRLGTWRLWIFISYASFFTYLYHRQIWHILLTIFPQDTWYEIMMFRLTFGSVLAILVGYVLQSVYDALLGILRKRYSKN